MNYRLQGLLQRSIRQDTEREEKELCINDGRLLQKDMLRRQIQILWCRGD